jgi:hypothetical protein
MSQQKRKSYEFKDINGLLREYLSFAYSPRFVAAQGGSIEFGLGSGFCGHI